jgi:hypothetical protein
MSESSPLMPLQMRICREKVTRRAKSVHAPAAHLPISVNSLPDVQNKLTLFQCPRALVCHNGTCPLALQYNSVWAAVCAGHAALRHCVTRLLTRTPARALLRCALKGCLTMPAVTLVALRLQITLRFVNWAECKASTTSTVSGV